MKSFEDEFIAEILDEIRDNLISLGNVVDIIINQKFSLESASELLRIVHSIKGSAQAASLKNTSYLLHKFEDYIIEINSVDKKVTNDFIDLLLMLKSQLDHSVEILKKDINAETNYDKLNDKFDSYLKLNIQIKASDKLSMNSTDSRQILLLDDNIAFLKTFKEQLQMDYEDWSIEISDNGESALELALDNKYDLIITDFYMPKMNGDEFVSRIRNEQGINKSTPVIMVTGFKPDSEDDSTLWEGVFFLEKPITWKKLEFFINCIFKNIKKDSQ